MTKLMIYANYFISTTNVKTIINFLGTKSAKFLLLGDYVK